MGLDDKILEWLDNKFPTGIVGYGAYHALTHPWLIIGGWGRELKWAWQRATRGWDDTAVWSIDTYLSKLIPELVRRLAEKNIGFPAILHDDNITADEAEAKWNAILIEIAEGFEDYHKKQFECFMGIEDSPKLKRSFELLQEWFPNLWD